jgi:hypothetical protein
MWCLSTILARQQEGGNVEINDVVVAGNELSQLAVDVGWQLRGIGCGSDDQLGVDLDQVRPHWQKPG